jgi:hypothetical protein
VSFIVSQLACRQFDRGNFIGFEEPINNAHALNSCNVAAARQRGIRAEIPTQFARCIDLKLTHVRPAAAKITRA